MGTGATFMPLKSHSRITLLSFQTNAAGAIWDLKYQLKWKLDWRTWVLIYCDITAVVKPIVLHVVEDYVFCSGSVKENKYCHHFFTVRKLTGHDKQFSKFKFFVTFMRCVIYETCLLIVRVVLMQTGLEGVVQGSSIWTGCGLKEDRVQKIVIDEAWDKNCYILSPSQSHSQNQRRFQLIHSTCEGIFPL